MSAEGLEHREDRQSVLVNCLERTSIHRWTQIHADEFSEWRGHLDHAGSGRERIRRGGRNPHNALRSQPTRLDATPGDRAEAENPVDEALERPAASIDPPRGVTEFFLYRTEGAGREFVRTIARFRGIVTPKNLCAA